MKMKIPMKKVNRKKSLKIIVIINNPPLTKPTVLLKWGLAKAFMKSQGL
jgi:hypothetical protein